MPLSLRVTSTPPGEAPLWVREKWVGLVLPLAQRAASPVSIQVSGILSGPKGFMSSLVAFLLGRYERQSGYVVEVLPALEILGRGSPEAASWWRENASHLVKPKRFFVFHHSVGYVNEPDA